MTSDQLSRLIRRSLKRSHCVEIDGLGVFARDVMGRISLRDANRLRIFIAYAVEDVVMAEKLFQVFRTRGYSPWLDRRNLLPGQNWPRRIDDAIANADFVVACFSGNSVKKRGGFQAELRYALDCATRLPMDEVFLIPVRLDDCRVPVRIQRETQYVDLFPDFDSGVERVESVIEAWRRRAA